MNQESMEKRDSEALEYDFRVYSGKALQEKAVMLILSENSSLFELLIKSEKGSWPQGCSQKYFDGRKQAA